MAAVAAGSPGAHPADGESVDLAQAWALSPLVSLRPEPFGALAYHFGNRRLVFLRRPELVAVVRGLAAAADVRAALAAAGVAERHWPAYAGALTRLAEAGLIQRRAGQADGEGDEGP
jgi:putative mycofactocin binding protein MftB